MIKHLERLESWFDGRPARERNSLSVAAIAAMLLLFEFAWWGPERGRTAMANTEVASLEEQKSVMQGELDELKQREAIDPDAAIRERLDAIDHRIEELDVRLRDQTLQILSPGQMPAVLRDVIGQGSDLRITGIRSVPPERLVNSANDDLPVLYRHGLVIDLKGDYLALLDYVRALEELPWRFYWLGLTVSAHANEPRRFRLHVYTVSLREEWVRV